MFLGHYYFHLLLLLGPGHSHRLAGRRLAGPDRYCHCRRRCPDHLAAGLAGRCCPLVAAPHLVVLRRHCLAAAAALAVVAAAPAAAVPAAAVAPAAAPAAAALAAAAAVPAPAAAPAVLAAPLAAAVGRHAVLAVPATSAGTGSAVGPAAPAPAPAQLLPAAARTCLARRHLALLRTVLRLAARTALQRRHAAADLAVAAGVGASVLAVRQQPVESEQRTLLGLHTAACSQRPPLRPPAARKHAVLLPRTRTAVGGDVAGVVRRQRARGVLRRPPVPRRRQQLAGLGGGGGGDGGGGTRCQGQLRPGPVSKACQYLNNARIHHIIDSAVSLFLSLSLSRALSLSSSA